MEHDIEKALQLIDAKIKKLEDAKQTLIDLFGGADLPMQTTKNTVTAEGGKRVRLNQVQEPRLSRKQTIIKLLTDKGPLSKKEIFIMTGMPRGSVSFTLNDKDKFYSQDGKWHLVGVHVEASK